MKWSYSLFEAFIYGAYMLYWTQNTLFWVAKPVVRKKTPTSRILHSENSPAIECDLEDLFFLNGVLVPEWLVKTDSGKIDPKLALTENNVDVQREIIRKVGAERMLKVCDAKTLDVFHDHHSNGGNEYKLMEMNIGQNIRRKYLYFEHASLPGVWYAQPVHPDTKKALHGRAMIIGVAEHSRDGLSELEKMRDSEIAARLPAEVA